MIICKPFADEDDEYDYGYSWTTHPTSLFEFRDIYSDGSAVIDMFRFTTPIILTGVKYEVEAVPELGVEELWGDIFASYISNKSFWLDSEGGVF